MSKTVVGLFDSMEEAEKAKRDLISEGYSAPAINVVANNTSGDGVERHDSEGTGFAASISNFFRSLTGGDSEDEHYYRERVGRGKAMLMVTVPDERVDRAEALLERCGAKDVDEQSGYETSSRPDRYESNSRTDLKDTVQEGRSIPVVQEELQVGKRQVRRGGVRVYSEVTERPVEETIRLRDEHVTVERHSVDRPATEADFKAFESGPFELTETAEEAVVSRKARVVEEVVVDKKVSEHTETVRDKVRATNVQVEQIGSERGNGSRQESLDADFRSHFNTTYGRTGGSYDSYAPAYRYGATLANDARYSNADWDSIEPTVRGDWSSQGRGAWEDFKAAIRHGWERTKSAATHVTR